MKETADQLTIDMIREHEFVGNHADDAPAFHEIGLFIQREDIPMDQKIEALQIMQIRGMGLEVAITAREVEDFIAFAKGGNV